MPVFLAVARLGSLTAAARHMNLGLATISRRIERMELAVGDPLFLRHQSGYRLTEEGQNLIERAESMEAAVLSITNSAQKDTALTGTVRLATAENLATDLILGSLSQLRTQYPQLTIEIVTDIATVNLHRRDADIALRLVKPERGNVSLQRLGTLGFGLYGSDSYLAARTATNKPEGYNSDRFIGWSESYDYLPAAQWLGRTLRGRRAEITTTSLATQLVACCEGMGLAILPHFLAGNHALTCLEPDIGLDQPLWLVTQSDLAQSRRVQVVAEFIRELVQHHNQTLAGADVHRR